MPSASDGCLLVLLTPFFLLAVWVGGMSALIAWPVTLTVAIAMSTSNKERSAAIEQRVLVDSVHVPFGQSPKPESVAPEYNWLSRASRARMAGNSSITLSIAPELIANCISEMGAARWQLDSEGVYDDERTFIGTFHAV
jgi:hypothetical protein